MIATVIFGLLFGALQRRWRPLPALGPALSPFTGLWIRSQSPFAAELKATYYEIAGLHGQIQVQVDSDQVKHVFAERDEDLYFAQGWILATERLWEMEFIVRLASGRLAEIVGPQGLPIDLMFHKLGIPEAAKESATYMLQDREVASALQAYANGVNAYIATLKPEQLPFEFRLLGHTPEAWKVTNAALLLKFMAFSLSGFSFDLPLTRSRSVLSKTDFDELFPLSLHEPEPIMPASLNWPFGPANLESGSGQAPKKEFIPKVAQANDPTATYEPGPNPANGSNNWAVSGQRSSTGLPILSNDIHLSLTLPSLWYEIQLVSKTQNVYGVALPGAPGVILGFNQNLAWGVTNGDTDVLDWYQLRYRDQTQTEYLFNKSWRPVISRDVQIKVKGAPDVQLKLRRTHFGPIVYEVGETPLVRRIPKGMAMRWAGLDPSNELKTFLLLNRAKNIDECRKAIETYQSPDQNFLCADNAGGIGMWHMGQYPHRWPGQGRMISDGTDSAYEWKGWISRKEVPGVKNPQRGFLSSANQIPVAENYPYFLGWWFESPFRGMRINELLQEKIKAHGKLSPEDFIDMQMDTVSILARQALPSLLAAVQNSKDLTESEQKALLELTRWDHRFNEQSIPASIFYAWWHTFEKRVWSRYFPDPVDYLYPRAWTTLRLLTQAPNSKWFAPAQSTGIGINAPTSPSPNSLHDVARASLQDALAELTNLAGSQSGNWAWAKLHPTEFEHLAKIPGLGSGQFQASGAEGTVFANQGHHGPVWKQVVALGAKPRAWGIYPGGQSGDPTSPDYDNFISSWRVGQLKELSYLMNENEHGIRYLKSITLKGSPQ